MTRDQATRLLVGTMFPGEQREGDNMRRSAALVDAWAKLGMLKLDTPKSQDERLAEATQNSFGFSTSPSEMSIFRAKLEDVGLKIVEA